MRKSQERRKRIIEIEIELERDLDVNAVANYLILPYHFINYLPIFNLILS